VADIELKFAEELATLLRAYGEVELQYVTAEMQPYSNAQRPDVVWTPKIGGYANQLFFFEIKLSTKPIMLGRGFRNLLEHLEFAKESLDRAIAGYVFVTNADIPEFSERFLSENNVHSLANVNSPSDVIEFLRQIGVIA